MKLCEGHPAGPFDPMGETVYCDGTCSPESRLVADIDAAPRLDESVIEYLFRTTGETELSVTLRSDHKELD